MNKLRKSRFLRHPGLAIFPGEHVTCISMYFRVICFRQREELHCTSSKRRNEHKHAKANYG